ncbi:threonine-phosphate decarboxylase CobD [Marinobacter salicampi]|uniref:threonine-phosphate decarboxylase CobD n=1 Tax=Marinobacter salicampi TaxID=435907 RepID=UPI0030FE04F2
MVMPEHGGRLNAASKRWGRPAGQWLDLSTGINPRGWPVPDIPAEIWRRLPEAQDGLEKIVLTWVQAGPGAVCVPVAGSQAAIQTLPFLRSRCRVGIPEPGYREHGHGWARAGHHVVPVSLEAVSQGPGWLDTLDVLVWIHPNNPTGLALEPQMLMDWHRRLSARGGWLVVDEAFIDEMPGRSLAGYAGDRSPGLIIMRSLGKFFGLAGVRAGAVLTDSNIADALEEALGPWPMSAPARYVMARALQDLPWQASMRSELESARHRLIFLLTAHDLAPAGGTSLFQYIPHQQARQLADNFARLGILLRCFDRPPALRIGLPGSEDQWRRLAQALAQVKSN